MLPGESRGKRGARASAPDWIATQGVRVAAVAPGAILTAT